MMRMMAMMMINFCLGPSSPSFPYCGCKVASQETHSFSDGFVLLYLSDMYILSDVLSCIFNDIFCSCIFYFNFLFVSYTIWNGGHLQIHHHCRPITTPVTFIKSFDCGARGDLFLEGWKEMGAANAITRLAPEKVK